MNLSLKSEKTKSFVKYKYLIFTAAISLISVLSLFHAGLPPTHDGEYHVIRFYEFDKTIRSGVWYPRWAQDLNFGYGIPLFNYVYPLPSYAAFFLHFLGLSFIDSFKLQMVIASIIGAIFFYLWTRKFWGEYGGVVSSVFYTFSPYRFLDIYIRGSVGEVWAIALFPACLWTITEYFYSKRIVFFILSSIFYSAIIFSHNILAVMFSGLLLVYVIFLISQKKEKIYFLTKSFLMILLGICLSAIFWLPALLEKKYVVGLEVFDPTAHFPEIYELLVPSWGSGFSNSALDTRMSFQIGFANLIAVILSIGALYLLYRKRNNLWKILLLFILFFLIIFYIMLPASLAFWKIIPIMQLFQFPWRFLSIEILYASFLAGGVYYVFKDVIHSKITRGILFVFYILLPLGFSAGYMSPSHYLLRDDSYYITRSNFIDSTNSPGNAFNTKWMNLPKKRAQGKIDIIEGQAEVSDIERKVNHSVWKINVLTKLAKLNINTAYFPGWTVLLDSYKTPYQVSKMGTIEIAIPQKDHTLELVFKDTFIRMIASIITVLSIFALFLFLLSNSMRKLNIP